MFGDKAKVLGWKFLRGSAPRMGLILAIVTGRASRPAGADKELLAGWPAGRTAGI